MKVEILSKTLHNDLNTLVFKSQEKDIAIFLKKIYATFPNDLTHNDTLYLEIIKDGKKKKFKLRSLMDNEDPAPWLVDLDIFISDFSALTVSIVSARKDERFRMKIFFYEFELRETNPWIGI